MLGAYRAGGPSLCVCVCVCVCAFVCVFGIAAPLRSGSMLGAYRALYIANWIYRAKTEPHYHTHLITIVSGVVQTALYVDFFYHYVTAKMLGKSSIELPSA